MLAKAFSFAGFFAFEPAGGPAHGFQLHEWNQKRPGASRVSARPPRSGRVTGPTPGRATRRGRAKPHQAGWSKVTGEWPRKEGSPSKDV